MRAAWRNRKGRGLACCRTAAARSRAEKRVTGNSLTSARPFGAPAPPLSIVEVGVGEHAPHALPAMAASVVSSRRLGCSATQSDAEMRAPTAEKLPPDCHRNLPSSRNHQHNP